MTEWIRLGQHVVIHVVGGPGHASQGIDLAEDVAPVIVFVGGRVAVQVVNRLGVVSGVVMDLEMELPAASTTLVRRPWSSYSVLTPVRPRGSMM